MFLTALKAEFTRGRVGAVLIAKLVYFDEVHGCIEVPPGFKTDFASVPGWVLLPGLVPRVGILRDAAVIHDFIYRNHYNLTRKDADQIFLRAMKDIGVHWWRRHLAYRAVRVGGRSAWKNGS